MESIHIALVQAAPVHMNLSASLEKAGSLIAQAAIEGAQLVVFGETWLPGYPAWLDHCTDYARWDDPGTKAVFARLHANSLRIPGPESTQLAAWSQEHGLTVVMGAHEATASGTLYNVLLTFGPEGRLLNHHRKLMPTYTEKLLHHTGDGHGLRSVAVAEVNIGGLICWEHWMPHARQALHEEVEHVHVAAWPMLADRHLLASRHYAFEGRCYVCAAGQLMQVKDVPPELRLPEKLANQPVHYLLAGGSCIIGPDAQYIVEPVYEQETILYADLPLSRLYEERMTLDVAGHYQRRDVFGFTVDRDR